MTVVQAIILGIVQGLTEFFPVSSSGHLVLGQLFFDIHEDVLLFDICVHLGTLFAVLLVFRRSVARLIASLFGGLGNIVRGANSPAGLYRESSDIRTILAILIGTIPAVVVGFTMKDTLESLFHSALAVFLALAFTGCVLLITFMFKDKRRNIGVGNGFLIGIAQALAITPGVSRSGMTISTAMFLGVKREDAGEFSFLLSVPAILGATLLTVKDYLEVGDMSISMMALGAGFLAAFLSGWVSLAFLMGLVRKGRLGYFGFYCLAVAIVGLMLQGTGAGMQQTHEAVPPLTEQITQIPSSFDGELQHVRYMMAEGENRPLMVALHTWSHDYTQVDFEEYAAQCRERNWHLIFPDFRGENIRSDACASEAVIQDVLDAVAWAKDAFSVDHDHVYLCGQSGGGHLALMMAAREPAIWTAVSAWVPISDLARWHAETTERRLKYADEMVAVCGGAPGASPEVDAQYEARSSIHTLWRAHIVPLDINAGIHDGHHGNSVPVGQSIRAFNTLANYVEDYEQMIGEDAIAYIEEHEQMPDWCDPGDTFDPAYPVDVHLRRTSKLTRLTILEGGHEILYDAAFAWFDAF